MQLIRSLLMLLGWSSVASAFSWKPERRGGYPANHNEHPSHTQTESPLPNLYAMALSELEDLVSEPLCHRVAARLLVDNCHLLDGKDEATVLTDSGRLARDFVDSYAASLAICDLQRGSFRIPSACFKFQESALTHLPLPSKPDLHVSTHEIDRCLEGLAQSDPAWNTWVSYRHKALRFCDAARADNEKDQNIRLHQRLTKILDRLTTEIEPHLQNQMRGFGEEFEKTNSKLHDLGPQLDAIAKGLEEVDQLSQRISEAAENSGMLIDRASSEAKNFQELLDIIIQGFTEKTEDAATTYETTLGDVIMRASHDTNTVIAMLASAVDSSLSLKAELENSESQTTAISRRQANTELGMEKLEAYLNAISTRYEEHGETLKQVQSRTDQILESLNSAASSAASLQSSMSATLGCRGWWPYIYSPAISLLMGSYGLPPSIARNFALLGLGEMVGFMIANMRAIQEHIPSVMGVMGLVKYTDSSTGQSLSETGI